MISKIQFLPKQDNGIFGYNPYEFWEPSWYFEEMSNMLMSLTTMIGVTIIIIMVMVTIHTTLGIEATVIITVTMDL
jgi:hypothetical protein